jgi:hypothetical protein
MKQLKYMKSTAEISPELTDAVDRLLSVYSVPTVAKLLGWHSALHLRDKITQTCHQFPILNLSGSVGSGKTFTAHLFSSINGGCFTDLPMATVDNGCPCLLDADSVGDRLGADIGALVKSAWDGLEFSVRGRVSRVASPLIVASEEPLSRPGLAVRCIQVTLQRKLSSSVLKIYAKQAEVAKPLAWVCLSLRSTAKKKSAEWVKERLEVYWDSLPAAYTARRRLSQGFCLLGLELFDEVVQDLMGDSAPDIEPFKQALLEVTPDLD